MRIASSAQEGTQERVPLWRTMRPFGADPRGGEQRAVLGAWDNETRSLQRIGNLFAVIAKRHDRGGRVRNRFAEGGQRRIDRAKQSSGGIRRYCQNHGARLYLTSRRFDHVRSCALQINRTRGKVNGTAC